MAKKKVREHIVPDVDVELNMTPMIDIVFQMILFFIIITDFTQQDIALLTLPWSNYGEEDEGDDPGRVIINITAPLPEDPKDQRGKADQVDRILIKGKEYDFEGLRQYLEFKGVKYFPDPEKSHVSDTSVLVRCDGEQGFDYVKAILQICSLPSVAIYKIEIATAEKAE